MNFPKRNLRRSINGKIYSGNKKNKQRTNSEDNKKNYYDSADSSPLKNKEFLSVSDDNEEEDQKIKQEARELIEKTRKMMKDLSMDKATNQTQNNFSYRPNSKERLDKLSNSNCSVDSLTQKLLSKNKQIKLLERELKEKTAQLKIAQDKIQTKNEEIAKLNEALVLERSNNLKAENIKLQRKVFAVEKANEENKKMYEKLIEEYKEKLNNVTNSNFTNEKKITKIESDNTSLNREVEKMRKIIEEKKNAYTQLSEKHSIEKKANEKYKIQIDDLKLNLSNLCVLVKTLYSKECQFNEKRHNFFLKFNTLFKNNPNLEASNNFMSSTCSNSEYGYNRKEMNNINYQDRIPNINSSF